MRTLTNKESSLASGATYGVCEYDDYTWVTVNPVKPTDPVLIALEAVNAAAWGCIGGAVRGGIAGCIIGGVIGASGKTMAVVLADTYKMYLDAQKH